MKIEIFETHITRVIQANITRNGKTKCFAPVTQASLKRLFEFTSCKTCEGTGFVSYYENQSPLGSGRVWLEEIRSDCPDCLSMDKCPKCGMEGAIDWEGNPLKCYNPACDWEEKE